MAKDRTERRVDAANLDRGPQMSAQLVELSLEVRVKPDSTAKRGLSTVGEEGASALRSAYSGNLNFPNRRIRTRTYGGVGGK
jgi:hypothetical protein